MANMHQVAHQWAHASDTSRARRAGNVSTSGHAFTSYATDVAAWYDQPTGRVFLVTSESFSVSTSKHVSVARGAAYGRVFLVPYVVIGYNGRAPRVDTMDALHAGNLAHLVHAVRESFDKARRATTHAEMYAHEACTYAENAFRYAGAFDLGDEAVTRAAGADYRTVCAAAAAGAWPDDVAAHVARVNARPPRRRPARRGWFHAPAAPFRSLAARRAEWRAFRGPNVVPGGDIMLRARGDDVETSLGASVPGYGALRLYDAWRAGHDVVGSRVGMYRVDAQTPDLLTIGCHRLTRAECDAFAIVAGWRSVDGADAAALAIVDEMRGAEVAA